MKVCNNWYKTCSFPFWLYNQFAWFIFDSAIVLYGSWGCNIKPVIRLLGSRLSVLAFHLHHLWWHFICILINKACLKIRKVKQPHWQPYRPGSNDIHLYSQYPPWHTPLILVSILLWDRNQAIVERLPLILYWRELEDRRRQLSGSVSFRCFLEAGSTFSYWVRSQWRSAFIIWSLGWTTISMSEFLLVVLQELVLEG